MRFDAIQKLLKSVNKHIDSLSATEIVAVNDNSIDELDPPDIKSALEHLRTCLEYSTHDVSEKLTSIYVANLDTTVPNKDIYFPYGVDKNSFKGSCCKVHLKKVDLYMPDIYDLIESYQCYNKPHDEQWLINFIKITNKIKHFNEQSQVKADVADVTIGNNTIVIEEGSNIVFENCTVDGVKQDSKFHLGEGAMEAQPSNWEVKLTRKVKFRFQESDEFILRLLTNSYEGVKKYIDELYALLAHY